MARLKKRTRQCREIAKKKKKKIVKNTDNSNSADSSSTEDEVERVDNQIEDEAEQLFSVLMKNMKTLKMSKRPLVNLGNSRTTKYRRKIQALKNKKKNGQTLFQLLSKKQVQENLDNEIQDDEEEIGEKNVNVSIK